MDSISLKKNISFFFTSKIPESNFFVFRFVSILLRWKKGRPKCHLESGHNPLPGSCWLLAAAAFAAQKTNAKTKTRTRTTTRQETGRALKETEGLKYQNFTALEWNSAEKQWFFVGRRGHLSSPLLRGADFGFHHKFVLEVADLVAVERRALLHACGWR